MLLECFSRDEDRSILEHPHQMSSDLFLPSQTAGFLGTKIKKIKKAVSVLYVAENITDIGAVRKQRIDDFNKFVFVPKGMLVSFGMRARSKVPKPNVSGVEAGETVFVMCTK
jgi:hypothetical protein